MTDTDRTLSASHIERMVRRIHPDWTVTDARLADRGFTAVYYLTLAGPGGTGEYVLKASHDGARHGIDTEARLLCILSAHTDIPVPSVVGAVDDDPDLPSPFFLMDALRGRAIPSRDAGTLTDAALERVADATGSYLAELHALDAVSSFGVVDHRRDVPLRGGRPSGDPDQVTVTDARDDWPALVREWTDRELATLRETRFADVHPRVDPVLRARIDRLSGPFAPVLARIDHGIHNVLLDPDTGALTGMVDWAFTLATTPAYDLATVAHVLGGDVLCALPDVPDRRALVRDALLAGYRSQAGEIPPGVDAHADLYSLLAIVRGMNHLATGRAHVPDAAVCAHADGVRGLLARHLEETGE